MIFLSVGSELPFDRLVRTVDDWAGATGRSDVFAQIGPATWHPSHIQWVEFLSSSEFFGKFEQADLIVSHAGMGTILSALHQGKPILVMPRRGALRETRNDHQVATAKRLQEMSMVRVAMDETALRSELDRHNLITSTRQIGPYASPELIAGLRSSFNDCGI